MAKKSRPMGYIFPKRIKDAMQGGEPARKSYSMYVPKEEDLEKLREETREKIKRQDAIFGMRELYIAPDFCQICGKNMKDLDKKAWRKRGVCFDCVIRVENHLRVIGKYKEYDEQLSLRNYKAYLIDIREQAVEFVSNLKDEIKVVNHDGSFDTLKGDQQKVRDFINEEIKDLDKKLEEVQDIDMTKTAYEVVGIDIKQLAKELYELEKENKQKKLLETEVGKIDK